MLTVKLFRVYWREHCGVPDVERVHLSTSGLMSDIRGFPFFGYKAD